MVQLRVLLNDSNEVIALHKALKPDDKDVPRNVSLISDVVSEKRMLVYSIEATVDRAEDLLTVANVVDDVLRSINLVVNVLKNVK